jgi:hypothetical protein
MDGGEIPAQLVGGPDVVVVEEGDPFPSGLVDSSVPGAGGT